MNKRIYVITAIVSLFMYGCSLTQPNTTQATTTTSTSATQTTTQSTAIMTTTESSVTMTTTQSYEQTTTTVMTTVSIENIHEISFYSDGVLVLSYSVNEGELIHLPKDPFKLPVDNHYYEFIQWNGYVDQMVASSDLSFNAEFLEHEFILNSDTKAIAETRHLAAVQYINQYLLIDYPEEALKIHHGTDAYKTALNSFVTDLIATASTDLEKVQIIYQWFEDTITYDNECVSPYAFDLFETLIGDCLPQALLMVDMLKTAGFPASIATGDRGSTTIITEENMDLNTDHAWVLVYVDDKWELLDPLFDTYMPDLDYISSWYYTAMVDFTVPYYPNINMNAVSGVYYFNGFYYPVFQGEVQYDLGMHVLLADYYQITWRFNLPNDSIGYEEDSMNVTPQYAAYTNGWVYLEVNEPYESSPRILGEARPNGQTVSATLYQIEDIIHYFANDGSYMQIEGIALEDLDLSWGVLEVGVGAYFKFVLPIDLIEHDYTITYTVADPELVTMDESGYITTLVSGEATIIYKWLNPSGGLHGEGIIIFLISAPTA